MSDPESAANAPVEALQQLHLLRREIARLLVPVAERLLRANLACATAADSRTSPLYPLLVAVALDAALVELRVRTPYVERIRILAFGANGNGVLAFGDTSHGTRASR